MIAARPFGGSRAAAAGQYKGGFPAPGGYGAGGKTGAQSSYGPSTAGYGVQPFGNAYGAPVPAAGLPDAKQFNAQYKSYDPSFIAASTAAGAPKLGGGAAMGGQAESFNKKFDAPHDPQQAYYASGLYNQQYSQPPYLRQQPQPQHQQPQGAWQGGNQ